jgi:hypothetical protein
MELPSVQRRKTLRRHEIARFCPPYAVDEFMVLEHADEIIIGHLKPGGLLGFLLVDLPRSVPVIVLSQ